MGEGGSRHQSLDVTSGRRRAATEDVRKHLDKGAGSRFQFNWSSRQPTAGSLVAGCVRGSTTKAAMANPPAKMK